MSRVRHSGSEPTQRMLRVGEVIRQALCELLARGAVGDPAIASQLVSVSDVRMSADLRLATVYVMPLGGKNMDAVLAALDRNKKFLRAEIAARIDLKFAPEVRFRADSSFDSGTRIDALLDSPHVKRDLEPNGEKR